jgi:hypothetical protein
MPPRTGPATVVGTFGTRIRVRWPSHMVAMAVPDQLVGDIRGFFDRFR